MTDQEKELRMRISMLMDADLDGRENPRLIDRLEEDEELKSTWANYHLIGDVMRSSVGGIVDNDFASKISAIIAEEPTVLAPKPKSSRQTVRPGIVTLGLAASLAAVTILVGKSVNEHSEVFQVASNNRPGQIQLASKPLGRQLNQAESRFNDYLVMHNETAYMAGSAGMLSYARLVSSSPDR